MRRLTATLLFALAVLAGSWTMAQTKGEKEEFRALAIVNNNLGAGAGVVIMQVTRWSSDAERSRLATTLLEKGPEKLLDVLRDAKPVGTIRTPDSLGYDLRYARQTPTPDRGRNIVIATDRPISFWEARNQPRVSDYPFTIIQMQIPPEGKGKGTLSYATKITVRDKNTVELENFASAPVMLNEIEAKVIR